MNEQTVQINRVRDQIAKHIVTFIDDHLGQEFFVDELRRYVAGKVPVAPASPDRVLRDLRARGTVNYIVISRSKSLYRALPVKGQLELF